MADDIQKTIDRLTKTVEQKEATLKAAIKRAFADGKYEAHEERAISAIEGKIADIKKKIVELNAKRGVVDFEDSPAVVKGEVMPYDHATFRKAFTDSLNSWCQDKAIKLNSIRTFMIERKEPAGLALKDIVSVVELAVPQAKYLKTALDLAEIAEKAMNSYLKACAGKTPSLNEIHKAWADSLDDVDKAGPQLFKAFIEDYKKENSVPSGVHEVPKEQFLTACDNFRKTHLPDAKTVEKAFLDKVMKTVKDGMDWDGGAVGFADCWMMGLAGNFSKPGGQLDDVPNDILQAFKTVYGNGTKVIDLPVEVVVTMKNHMGGNTTVAKRSSKSPGNTSFSYVSGDKEFYDEFVKAKAWNLLKVGDLTLDT